MITFYTLDYVVIALFFICLGLIALYFYRKKVNTADEFFLNKRSIGLGLFIATNVATWYGGILGVGEFTYKFGVLSWVTQGLPYYFFAILFGLFLAKKIRKTNFFTIPELIEKHYGKKAAFLVSILVFVLTSPAPYLLMVGQLTSILFGLSTIWGIIIGLAFSLGYLFWGGYKSDVWSDLFMFFVMYGGFFVIFFFSYHNLGGMAYLSAHLPKPHLTFTGGASWVYILTWFLIALWTFADPGFHQRCYSAKTPNVAMWGILLSVPLWFIFDYLTVSAGLFARANSPHLISAVLAYPILAEKILPAGAKGLFFIALFATVLSTLNSFLFISAQTFGKDIMKYISKAQNGNNSVLLTRIGLFVTSIISIALALSVKSIIEIWYLIGSICIPGIILPVFGAYYKKLSIDKRFVVIEIIAGSALSLLVVIIKKCTDIGYIENLEPMIAGLIISVIVHLCGISHRIYSQRLIEN